MSELLPAIKLETDRQVEVQVCPVSLESARQITGPLLEQVTDPFSVVYTVANDRASRMQPGSRLGIAPILHVDPSRSGANAARYMFQNGEMPVGSVDSPEQAVILWMTKDKGDVPPLRVPDGESDRVMGLADEMQMRGGGPLIYAREEVENIDVAYNEVRIISAGANRANRERIRTAMEIARHHDLKYPMVITTDPTRVLREGERNNVASFAPEAGNEHQLVIDSARAEGLVLDTSLYGMICLPDGSMYQTMTHKETGERLIVLAPAKKSNGSGMYNAYNTLAVHGATILGESDFVIDGANISHVTSTHYGAMATMNNLVATTRLRLQLGSFKVVGDNQPKTRLAQAHLIEVGLTLNAFDDLTTRYPVFRDLLVG